MTSIVVETALAILLFLAALGFTLTRDFRKAAFYILTMSLICGIAFWIQGDAWSGLAEWVVGGLLSVLLIWFTSLTGTERTQPPIWQWVGSGIVAFLLTLGIVGTFLRHTASSHAPTHDLGVIETSVGLLALLWLCWIGTVAQARPEVQEKDGR